MSQGHYPLAIQVGQSPDSFNCFVIPWYILSFCHAPQPCLLFHCFTLLTTFPPFPSCGPAWNDPANASYTTYLLVMGFVVPCTVIIATSSILVIVMKRVRSTGKVKSGLMSKGRSVHARLTFDVQLPILSHARRVWRGLKSAFEVVALLSYIPASFSCILWMERWRSESFS